jgi:hypothetical protein
MIYFLTKENHSGFVNTIKQYKFVESVDITNDEDDGYVVDIKFKENVLLLRLHSERFSYVNSLRLYEGEEIAMYDADGYKVPIVEYIVEI